jgi:heat-inducible transcriptional repressor
MADDLDDRERGVLRAIVQEYITSGEPVGSSQLARRSEFDVSSATMRNVMADLEELGFLEKPHTSAGRIPTARGYRFYVDALLKLREPAPRDRELIEQGIPREASVEETFQEASKVLHGLTRHAGVVLSPRNTGVTLHRIEFLRLREDRVLAILVGRDGHVQNKLLTVNFDVTPEELIRASNYLTELLGERPIEDIRGRILTELAQEKAKYDALANKALKLGFAATDNPASDRMFIEGTGSLLDTPEFSDVEKVRALFRTLEEKHKLLALLDRVLKAGEMQIFIGAESEFSSAGDVTVIASPYGNRDQVFGTVGVIGPTRMNYQRVIPLVDFTAQVLSKMLDR